MKLVYHESTDALVGSIDQPDLKEVYEAIMHDPLSLFTLSTQAINFIYHVQNFFPELVTSPEPSFFIDLARNQSSKESWSLGAHLYLLTHVVIGASQFYTRDISGREKYVPLLRELEQIISEYYDQISLDQKCEFLLCAKLLTAESVLSSRVSAELARSFSPLGNYFVDTLNQHSKTKLPLKYSLFGSEHRNVLAIATFLPHEGGE